MAYGHEEKRTIYALASGVGKSAIAIIRISGPSTVTVVNAMIGRVPVGRKATFARIIDPGTGDAIDTGLVLWFPGPSSFTGEDSAEFQTHGSRAVVNLILKVLAGLPDMRMARPGEFARRAFENGKMDLISVEALGDLIESETEQQRRLAIFQSSGKLREQADSWRSDLIDALVMVESDLDFSDEADVALTSGTKARAICEKILRTLGPLAAGDSHAERLRDGMTVLIGGPPNAGKSTLLNAIARRDVAIVSERAGTTRDLIEVKLDLAGYPVNLIDTAGIRNSDDPVEREGINRAIKSGEAADLVLWLTPIGQGGVLPPKEFEQKKLWHIVTKADDLDAGADLALCALGENLQRAANGEDVAALHVSAKDGHNIGRLIGRLQRLASNEMSVDGSGLVANHRQRTALEAAQDALMAALDECTPTEILAEELRRACFALESLIGKVGIEDVLEQLFERFCIGK